MKKKKKIKSAKQPPTKNRLGNIKNPHKLTRKDSRKGGSVRSQNKKVAAQIRELKKKGIKDSTVQRMLDIMEDSEVSRFHIIKYLEIIRGAIPKGDVRSSLKLVDRYMDFHKISFPEKNKLEVNSFSMNFSTVLSDLEKRELLSDLVLAREKEVEAVVKNK
jgi:hypothetical protein